MKQAIAYWITGALFSFALGAMLGDSLARDESAAMIEASTAAVEQSTSALDRANTALDQAYENLRQANAALKAFEPHAAVTVDDALGGYSLEPYGDGTSLCYRGDPMQAARMGLASCETSVGAATIIGITDSIDADAVVESETPTIHEMLKAIEQADKREQM